MPFEIHFGIPEISDYWSDLDAKYEEGTLSVQEEKLFNKLLKAFNLLAENPKHNSLATHEIEELSKKFGLKIWQSYLENKTPSAGRLFWAYGPEKSQITILAIEPHPEPKRGSYKRIRLSNFPVMRKKK